MNLLQQFIQQNQLEDWKPGQVDCLMILSDWIVMLGWPDAASPYRGTYSTDEEMYDLVEKAGGLENLIEPEVSKHAITRCDQAKFGDIAVIGSANNPRRQFGAIWNGASWVVRTPTEFLEVKATARVIWRTGGASWLQS